MEYFEALQRIAHQLKGIADTDLTTAEKAIKRIVEDALPKPRTSTFSYVPASECASGIYWLRGLSQGEELFYSGRAGHLWVVHEPGALPFGYNTLAEAQRRADNFNKMSKLTNVHWMVVGGNDARCF